jgi:hypothetical protein
MAANTSVAIPADRATATAPVARFFVSEIGSVRRHSGGNPRPSNTGVRIFASPPSFPLLARNLGAFGQGG